MIAPRILGILLAATAIAACAGPAGVEVGPAAPGSVPPGRGALPTPRTRVDEIAAAPVYDAAGQPSACAAPLPVCPEMKPQPDFTDACRLAGFQVRQCGCEQRCSGNLAAARRRYDAAGAVKECAPARADCAPPPPSAAFQDACAEQGFRLDPCGCEWLCTGNVRR
jgi:hypothetical protein